MASENDLSIAKQVVDLAKELLTVVHGEAKEKPLEKAPEARGGPLQIVGRLYIGLTAIIALTASVAGYIDFKLDGITAVTQYLRCTVIGSVVFGLIGGIVLVIYLVRRHPMYLSSPTEFSSNIHETMLHEPAGGTWSGKKTIVGPMDSPKDEA